MTIISMLPIPNIYRLLYSPELSHCITPPAPTGQGSIVFRRPESLPLADCRSP
jgi:hypothetical protein